jgi:hypothetical protein
MGRSFRATAKRYQKAVSTVAYWVRRAGARALGKVDWDDRARGNPRPRRTPAAMVRRILQVRQWLRTRSALGECGAAAIFRSLRERGLVPPCVRTIARILAAHHVVRARRVRRAPPPPAWYLPEVSCARAELDLFDLVEGIALGSRRSCDVFTAISQWGGLCHAEVLTPGATTDAVLVALRQHWRKWGRPQFAQFDNAAVFQGSHGHPAHLGRVVHFCLCAGVTVVFVPPRETGCQAKIESFNNLWQQKVWQRWHYRDFTQLRRRSDAFVRAHRHRHATRIEAAPQRQHSAGPVARDVTHGRVIMLRRADDHARVSAFGRCWQLPPNWANRLTRCDWSLREGTLNIFGLRKHDPQSQPLLLVRPLHLRLTPWHSTPRP